MLLTDWMWLVILKILFKKESWKESLKGSKNPDFSNWEGATGDPEKNPYKESWNRSWKILKNPFKEILKIIEMILKVLKYIGTILKPILKENPEKYRNDPEKSIYKSSPK